MTVSQGPMNLIAVMKIYVFTFFFFKISLSSFCICSTTAITQFMVLSLEGLGQGCLAALSMRSVSKHV